MKKKFTIEDIREYYKDCSCKLLSEEYLGSNSPLKFVCSCGNIFYSRFRVRRKDQLCDVCMKKLQVVKMQKTKTDKYGDPNFFDKEKRKETWIQKYGVDNPLKSSKILEKRNNTNIEKYGTKHTFQSEKCKEKSRKTFLRKYGVEYGHQNKIIRNKFNLTIQKKYGVPSLAFLSRPASKMSQKLFWDLYESLESNDKAHCHFAELNGEFISNLNEEYYKYDFIISSLKIAIEFNGWNFHPREEQNDNEIGWCAFHPELTVKEAREKERNKFSILESRGYRFLVVWDYEYKHYENLLNKCLMFINGRNI